jgi:hypothetical protein
MEKEGGEGQSRCRGRQGHSTGQREQKDVIVGYQYLTGGYGNYDNILILDSPGNKLSQHVYVNGIAQDIIQARDKNWSFVGIRLLKLIKIPK